MTNKRAAVAMSGGVDSSLAAALMLEKGYEVIGVTMLLFDENPNNKNIGSKAVKDAKRVADFLGISHYVFDLRDLFKQKVINYFISSYQRGITPNPCVYCNETIKFGALYNEVEKLSVDYLVTGHYAQVVYNNKKNIYELHKGVDSKKDQSYFLYHLKQDQLSVIHFPLGQIFKEETREKARRYKLPVSDKADSQDICFIPNNDYFSFLKIKAPAAFKPGDIVLQNGKVIGRHKGLPAYTIGQRKGLGVATGKPVYVIALDVKRNRLVVGDEKELFSTELFVTECSFVEGVQPVSSFMAKAKIRYAANPAFCKVYPDENILRVVFEESQRAITPGQSVVFYEDNRVLGGGIIANNPLVGEE